MPPEHPDPDMTSRFEASGVEPVRHRPGGVFVVLNGPDRGRRVVLEDRLILIGSAPGCDLVLTDRTVSRRHVTVSLEGRQAVVRDLASTNGSYTHGSRFKEIAIRHGAELQLGKTLLKFLPLPPVNEAAPGPPDRFGAFIGQDAKMRCLFGLLHDIAPSDLTVLIEGETGSGKELIAEELHRHSRRASGPFVVFDCGAVPHELIESALFGHVKGAFTGAVADRRGAFAEANGGTLFLDEIGELAVDLQPALLRAIDKRAVRRVGDSSYEKVDVRIIAATHRNLREEVALRRFREDLYYRIAVIRVHLPPLRERGQDIALLAAHFMRQLAPDRKLTLPPDELARMLTYRWPGNVRQLRNFIERACVLSKGDTLRMGELLAEESADAGGRKFRTGPGFKDVKGQLVEQFEREYMIELMSRKRGNLSAAAREAGLDRSHLRELLRKHGVNRFGEQEEDAVELFIRGSDSGRPAL